jgi:hypothetical protein
MASSLLNEWHHAFVSFDKVLSFNARDSTIFQQD